jgi:hypothetical protein
MNWKEGYDFLKQFSDDVTKYDYREKTKAVNPFRGNRDNLVVLIIYDGKYNVKLSYDDSSLNFLIEDDYYKYINHNITYDDLSEAHFDYIADVIRHLKSHESKLAQMKRGFGNKLPIEYIRQQKLNQLV